MLKAQIAVLVSGGGTNLQQLLDAEQDGRLTHGEIVLVISDHADAYALERAEKRHVTTAIVEKKECADQKEFEQRILALLAQKHIDLIVLAGFMTILSADFTNQWPRRIINVHPALIPSFCGKGYYGLKVHEAALDYGVKVTGATVHFVNEVPDGGEIIMQKAVDVLPGDTPEILQRRVMEQAEWILLPAATELVAKTMIEDKEKAND